MNKRFSKLALVLITVLIITFTFAGCGSDDQPASGSAGYTDGTYEGSAANGQHGDLTVKVTVANGNISQVEVTSETEGPGTQAAEQLPPEIVKAQSTNVDDVSGATETSTAIKEAVNAALEEAK